MERVSNTYMLLHSARIELFGNAEQFSQDKYI